MSARAEKLGSGPLASTLEPVADGVWLLRMVPPMRTRRLSNVYLLEGNGGGAAGIGAPVLCHTDEKADTEGDGGHHYFDFSKVRNPLVRALAPGGLERWTAGR